MKVIIDTNVIISGIFWEGPPKGEDEDDESETIELLKTS